MVESIVRQNRMYYEEINFVPLLNRTANGTGATFILPPECNYLRLFLSVTGFGGTTPTLDVFFQETWDLSNGVTDVSSLGVFPQKTGVAKDILVVNRPFTRKVAAGWSIGGSAGPNFTFKVDGIARS